MKDDPREKHLVNPGTRVNLDECDPDYTGRFKKSGDAREALEKTIERLDKLQYLLYAENKHALLIVLQAMDAGGKDGTIRHVMRGMNPQGCRVTSFKAPSQEELDHDFLWRIHNAVPPKGEIGIFNRSHYEDVLIVRVHNLVQKSVWSKRYGQINQFEKLLAANNVRIVKFFLHISKDEQRKRFMERLSDPEKQWKFNPRDVEERQYWDDYMKAYEEALSRCSTDDAPWYVIPSNEKWYRNYAVARIIEETLEDMDMRLPKPAFDLKNVEL